MTLRPGDRGGDVADMQRCLGVTADGRYGVITTNAVMDYQKRHGLPITGIADIDTLDVMYRTGCIEKPIGARISQRAIDLIIDFEVGGGEAYYNKVLTNPTWPGGESGVTIGIGFDLGYETLEPWVGKLSGKTLARLSVTVGATGRRAMLLVSAVRDISIPWKTAVEVFETHTLPTEIKKTQAAFPGMENLHEDVQGALVSLVYNRGASMSGPNRSEMRQIKLCVETGDVRGIADALKRMKRLWVGKGLPGLLKRRDAEAALVLASLRDSERGGSVA